MGCNHTTMVFALARRKHKVNARFCLIKPMSMGFLLLCSSDNNLRTIQIQIQLYTDSTYEYTRLAEKMIKLQISGSNELYLTVLTTSNRYSNCSGRGYLTLVMRYAIAIISYYYVKTCLIILLYSPIIVSCSFNA
jgi:hypothetical protein